MTAIEAYYVLSLKNLWYWATRQPRIIAVRYTHAGQLWRTTDFYFEDEKAVQPYLSLLKGWQAKLPRARILK